MTANNILTHEITLRFDQSKPTAQSWHSALAEFGLTPDEYVLYLPTPEAPGAIQIEHPGKIVEKLLIAKLSLE